MKARLLLLLLLLPLRLLAAEPTTTTTTELSPEEQGARLRKTIEVYRANREAFRVCAALPSKTPSDSATCGATKPAPKSRAACIERVTAELSKKHNVGCQEIEVAFRTIEGSDEKTKQPAILIDSTAHLALRRLGLNMSCDLVIESMPMPNCKAP